MYDDPDLPSDDGEEAPRKRGFAQYVVAGVALLAVVGMVFPLFASVL